MYGCKNCSTSYKASDGCILFEIEMSFLQSSSASRQPQTWITFKATADSPDEETSKVFGFCR